MPPVNRNAPKRAQASESKYTVMDFMRDFPDDETCLAFLWRQNISLDGAHANCPKCKTQRRFHKLRNHPAYSCDVCGHHLHPLAGTIFHKSSTSLVLWFHAIFLMSQTRCGISAKQLERDLGVTYKTAWRMFQKIRSMLAEGDNAPPMSGKVEMDETYVGGKRRAPRGQSHAGGRPGADDSHKTPVFGMVERGGRVRAVVVEDARRPTLTAAIGDNLDAEATVITDEWPAYRVIARSYGDHWTIHHASGDYVRGDVYTNTIEGFWALTKNAIRGVHHGVGRKHLQSYLNEYAFRWNHRSNPMPMFSLFLAAACRPRPVA
jgi:transposase